LKRSLGKGGKNQKIKSKKVREEEAVRKASNRTNEMTARQRRMGYNHTEVLPSTKDGSSSPKFERIYWISGALVPLMNLS